MSEASGETRSADWWPERVDARRALTRQGKRRWMMATLPNNSPHGDTMTLEHLDRLVRLQGQVLSDMAEAMTNLKDAVWALNEKVRVLEAREEER